MKEIVGLVALLLGTVPGHCAATGTPQPCTSGLTPTVTVAPRLPPELHNEFTGKAEVSFVIDPAGRVQSPTIVATDWHPVGRSTGQPVGYNEAILSAIAQWRFPQRSEACLHRVPVAITFAATDGPR